jgi:CxxC motif-containing protein (DUF1111 family)
LGPLRHIDQLIWRVPGSEEPQGVGIFARFIGAPKDRNLIDFYFDGGLTFSGMIPGRPNDMFAIGFAYTGISDQVGACGPMSPDVMISPRVAPPMIGLGLLEAVPEEQILANAVPEGADRDGISGKPNRVWSREHEKVMLGRFGWKAGVPTIAQQAAEAFAGDIGISTTMMPFPSGDCTEKQSECLNAPNGNSPRYQNVEVGNELFDLVTFYSKNLAVPSRRKPDDPEVLKGKELFYKSGCTGCHNPKFITGEVPGQPHLSHQLIYPYSDMLLHDIGEGLADHRPEGEASGYEWRTPPLWGVGLTETVSGHTLFLHDGRARNVTEAILWHGGEGQAARDAFANLPKEDRDRLIAFVNSL